MCTERYTMDAATSAEDVENIIHRLKQSETDTQFIEVKESVKHLPKSISETVSAFANGSGGIIILGLSEQNNFAPAAGFSAKRIADSLALLCSDKLTPPVRADIEIIEYSKSNIVIARISEILPRDKPCYVKTKGMYRGSYIRTFDGDRLLSQYEIDRLLEDKTQPVHDIDMVMEASMHDIDKELLQGVIGRQKKLHPRLFLHFSDDEIAIALRIANKDSAGEMHPTLAGLLALGVYPQKYFPRLTVTFAAYPGTTKAPENGVKFLDSQKMVGSIPAIIEDTIAAVQKNTRLGGVMDGALRIDVPDYPEVAVREAVCNALMHRDYSPLARGTQVQVNLYNNRLEVLSPGGLFGTVTADTIDIAGYSSTRNQYLADILESTPYKGGFVAENRGTGFRLMKAELAHAQCVNLMVRDSISMFTLEFCKCNLQTENESTACSGVNRNVLVKCELHTVAEQRTLQGKQKARNCENSSKGHASESKGKSTDKILDFISNNERCSAAEISKGLSIPRSTVTYQLKKLIANGKIQRIGTVRSRNQKYCLATQEK